MAAARLPEELARVARELYGLPPEEFTAARTAAVKQARGAGDKELAKAVGALRRPALAAWAVNLLVREQAGLLEQVTAMGDSLREAQAQLDGEALRDLTRQRRRLVTAVTAQVAAVAAEHDHPLSAAASRLVEETVQAALVDPRAAAAVRSGLLVAPLASTGVESLAEVLGIPLPDSGSVPGSLLSFPEAAPEPASEPAPGAGAASGRPALSLVPEDEEATRREAEERAAERAAAAQKAARRAEKSAAAAAKARDKAETARAKAQARLLQLEAEAEELRHRLAEVETRAEEAATKLADRESAAEEAVSAAEAAAREAEEARAVAAEATEAATAARDVAE